MTHDLYIENHMVLNNDAHDDEDAEPEPTEVETLRERVACLERHEKRVRQMERHIMDFLAAIDRGYFGRDTREDLDSSAFVLALRQEVNLRYPPAKEPR